MGAKRVHGGGLVDALIDFSQGGGDIFGVVISPGVTGGCKSVMYLML